MNSVMFSLFHRILDISSVMTTLTFRKSWMVIRCSASRSKLRNWLILLMRHCSYLHSDVKGCLESIYFFFDHRLGTRIPQTDVASCGLFRYAV